MGAGQQGGFLQAALWGPSLSVRVPLCLEFTAVCVQAAGGQEAARWEVCCRPSPEAEHGASVHIALRAQSLCPEFQEQLPSLPRTALLQILNTLLEFQSY